MNSLSNEHFRHQKEDDPAETPVCGTPGILKRVNMQSAKKRRVMFASPTNDSDAARDDDVSSSSEVAMEIEVRKHFVMLHVQVHTTRMYS